jgi:large subunit ribosomal protein L10
MRHEKQFLMEEVKGQMNKYQSFVILRYLKFSANALNGFRTAIAQQGGEVEMVRKRILIKAAMAAGIPLTRDALDGHIGLVYAGKDPLETAKYVFNYSRDNEGTVKIIGGHIDGQMYTAAQVDVLSTLPGKDEMRAQLLSVFEAPLSQTLAVMEALLTSVPHCLENKGKASAGAES